MLFFTVFRPPYPEHDSSQILAIKNSCYKQHIDAIRTYYKKEHQNWCVIDAFRSKWWIWDKVLQEVQGVVKEIQVYLERIREGKRKTKFHRIIFVSLRSCNVMSAFQLQLALDEANSWAHAYPQILWCHLERSWRDLLKRPKRKPTTGQSEAILQEQGNGIQLKEVRGVMVYGRFLNVGW